MSKINITRTELVWPGKYDDEGNLAQPRRVNLPFQVIERVNETRATRAQREKAKAGHVGHLFDYWQDDEKQNADGGDGWRNKLIWGDNQYVMGSLLDKFAGKIDLIYIDPPFATGADFTVTTEVGDEEVTKEQSLIEEKVYRDTWGNGVDSFIPMIYERLALMHDLLTENGSIYVHVDYRLIAHFKLILDEIFGNDNFVNEIIWKRGNHKQTEKMFVISHDNLLFYTKSKAYAFNPQYGEYDKEYIEKYYGNVDTDGRRYQVQGMYGKGSGPALYFGDKLISPPKGLHWRWTQERINKALKNGLIVFPRDGNGMPRFKDYLDDKKGVPVRSIWDDVYEVNSQALERVDYPTQKPEVLLERIIHASSNEGDLVADFFGGSGTTAVVAEKNKRRWIACDLGRYAIHTSRKRLMDIAGCKPFEILNLGQYERQMWQGIAFEGQRQPQQMLVFEYLKFILDLYGAQPLPGTVQLHGKKGSAMVHVGAVDAPVTINEVNDCLAECKGMHQKELHILGWEWEMGVTGLMVGEAKVQGVKLLLLTIPREVMEQQAVDKGDVRFFELAYLEAEPLIKNRAVTVKLTDFVIPNDELIAPEVRKKIKKWSDYVDYWAVDWDFQYDAFMNGWTSYRTRQDRTLQLKTESHEYAKPGDYHILVKVIDIFGNDTSQIIEVKVK